jgi:regulator of RNase E activity RraA
MVKHGDLLHGDANGVTSIPLELASEIADIAPEFVAAEQVVLDYVRSSGTKTPQGLTDARKAFSARVTELAKRARAARGDRVWKV